MYYPIFRPRRLRETETFRRMVRETHLTVDDLIMPFFVVHGRGVRREISSMPGNWQLSVDEELWIWEERLLRRKSPNILPEPL